MVATHDPFIGRTIFMSHRLLHSIVFASTSLLACGGQIDVVTASPDATPQPQPDGAFDPVLQKPAVTVPDAAVDANIDKRSCEGGWPTTKGQICTFDAGIACCTSSFDSDSGVICCEVGQGQ